MHITWILAADEYRGRIFEAQSRTGAIQERESLVHPESRTPESQLTSDASGRNRSNSSLGAHSLNEAGRVREHHAEVFAKAIVAKLSKAHQQDKFSALILVAAPKFLGTLRKEIGNDLKQHVCLELNKDLTKLKVHEMRKRLPERLPINPP